MERNHRSEPKLVHATLDVKSWIEHPPSVDAVRPGRCPRCGTASRPVGERLRLWGHGVRRRQVRGPLTVDGSPALVDVAARRYRCRSCAALVLVVPSGLVARRLFTASAIGLALALFGLERMPLPRGRTAVSPWTTIGATAAAGWLSVRRWIRAVRDRRLFARLHLGGTAQQTAHQIAARVARALSALGPSAPTRADVRAAVFAGARTGG